MKNSPFQSETHSAGTPLEQAVPRASRDLLWLQVKNSILDLISTQQLQADAPLPSESELCTRFGVSRTVVREAMNQLVYEHVIYKRQGKGAFVAGRRESQEVFVSSAMGFSDEWLGKHRTVMRRILVQQSKIPGPRVQEMLRLPTDGSTDSRVVEIARVLSAENIPRMFVTISIPERLVPGLAQLPLQTRSLYDILRRQYGLHFKSADRWIEATAATPEAAKLLQVAIGTPLIEVESCAYNETGQPVEYFKALCRTDLGSLHFPVRR
ncbi:GntR family transcriptional regulator [Rhodoferax sp. GW822-FHT02A01]|uniref:GntR family transcriptional regulator n=1 Tax=Rhodoferax sp. GW822-FHT02A01 TaxID=3141537 RepID=UPI00315D52CB